MHYSKQAKEKTFEEVFPESAFYMTFPSIDEAYDYVNIASAKFGQSVGNKRRDKGLGAKLMGPELPVDSPVTVVCRIFAGTGGVSRNIDLSAIDKPLETVIRVADTDALLIFMVFANDKAIALSTYYLDPKYSGYSNGNAQIQRFGAFNNTYDTDYPVGWGIEKAFQYLKEGFSLNDSQNRIAASPTSNTASSGNGNRVKTPRPASERNDPAKTEEERITAAVAWGDCAYLYAYTQRADADSKLAAQATAAIKRYSGMDSGVGKYLNDKMEAQVRKVPKDLMEKVFVQPAESLPGVVSSLVTGVSDQFLKAKILHDWICDNIAYDAGMYFSGRITAQDYESVLKKKLAVCSGYTNLYNEMCALAGVESIGINGYSKGFGYNGKIGKDTDHAWNAVKIGGRWYLVDVTWDAGYMEIRTFIKKYSTGWLFVDPRPFLYSHLPEEEAYQFYAPVLTAEDFMREAYIPGKFFQYGLLLKTEDPEYHNIVDGGFTFDLTLRKSNVSLSSGIHTEQGRTIDAASWETRKGGTITFDFDVPDTAEYEGYISAKWQNEEPIHDIVDIATFEREWLPGAEGLLAEKNITEKEWEFFKDSYFKVEDNNRYYFKEDQFDTSRNNAVSKIHKLLELGTGFLEPVLDFNIKAASGYQGFGNNVLKYPFTFSTYNSVPNTQLISPITGTLKAGSTQTFTVSSTDYSSFAIIIDGQWNNFVKNAKTGNFELTFTVPAKLETLTISGMKGNTYWGLIQYKIVP